MRIVFIGPGMMSIPPKGWGAVESLIWDYYQTLQKKGYDVHIVNTFNSKEIVNQTNNLNPDFVHIHYDDWAFLADQINCPHIGATSHYAYLDQKNKMGGYKRIFDSFINNKKIYILALSESIKQQYIKHGFNSDKIYVVPNGVRDDLFYFQTECLYPDQSIYVAKIDDRKRQAEYQDIESINFVGNIADNRFKSNRRNYLGEWSRDYLYNNLTNYANLVLLSDGEAHPLVPLEAMCCGLGLVLSEPATSNLDLNKEFIDVIPQDKIYDKTYINKVISENREKSIQMREEIRQYAIDNFSWNNIVENYYIPVVKEIIKK